MPGQKLFFIVNPTAGRGRALHTWRALETLLQHSAIRFCHGMTAYPGHATLLARQAVADGFKTCVAVGGDGTLSELVPALVGTKTALACVPAGTGNDFARGLGWPRAIENIVPLLLTATRGLIDVLRVNDRLHLNVASVGFDAVVADTVNRQFRRTHGSWAYMLGLAKTLCSYRNASLSICLDDGQPIQCHTLLVAVGNLNYYGGGMKICPHASPSDGLLDICVAGSIGKIGAVFALPSLMKGTHLGHPKVIYRRAKSARIEGPPLPVQADGQIIGVLPVTFKIEPSALWTLLPP